jgi:7-cyano-7-deazaguanine synthase
MRDRMPKQEEFEKAAGKKLPPPPPLTEKKAVTIMSGGMDSVTLAFWVMKKGYKQRVIAFNYGQRHSKELIAAERVAHALGAFDYANPNKMASFNVVDISSIMPMLHGSSQTDSNVDVPEGHYSADNMKLTVVPNRNAIMLSIAYGAAVASKAERLFYGAHSGDHFIYPDCRPEFVRNLSEAFHLGNEGFQNPNLEVQAPFSAMSKADILKWGLANEVPYQLTWTCYKGGEKACGKCGSCCERLEAFFLNSVPDPIEYEDTQFWRTAKA